MRFKKIYIEITNLCNKNCSFCSKDSRKKEEMTPEYFEHILKEIRPYTNYVYLHVKGEPLLHSKLQEILELCKKYEVKVNITTNGTLLKEKSKLLIPYSNIYQMNVSLHSFDYEEDYMEKILEATDLLLEKTNIYINYRFWALQNHRLTKENKELIKKIETHYHLPILKDLEKNYKKTISSHLFIEEGELFTWPTLLSSYYEESGTCYGLRTHFAILVDGTVVPCCLDSEANIPLGNVFEEPLSSILSKEKVKEIASNFQSGKIKEELCKHCTYRKRFEKERKEE